MLKSTHVQSTINGNILVDSCMGLSTAELSSACAYVSTIDNYTRLSTVLIHGQSIKYNFRICFVKIENILFKVKICILKLLYGNYLYMY